MTAFALPHRPLLWRRLSSSSSSTSTTTSPLRPPSHRTARTRPRGPSRAPVVVAVAAGHSLDDALNALRAARARDASREDYAAAAPPATSADVDVDEAAASSSHGAPTRRPTVHLVGTGPGDPGLLTLRAVELMRSADVVLYDRLVSPEILQYVGGSARMVYVGKEKSFHTRSQAEIHALLREFALTKPDATIVRLKGGDPFVFGRGGEETEYLEQCGIRVRAVPGITAAAGIGAELGIPLTHRGVAHSVRFLTGHMRDGIDAEVGDMPAGTTLVIYMGLSLLRPLVETLSSRGLTPETPAVAVERGTTPEQRVVWATAAQLADKVDDAQLKSPTLIIIGDVVRLAPGFRRAIESGVSLSTGSESEYMAPVQQVVPPATLLVSDR
jgi:uroporphyrin-III C-methyltransferase